ncbi:hypothetical protein MBIO_0476 [Mycoplasmopsis fermentans PG18]|uniref:Uncharacterized protein n=1 Tax=Mycoplasmopsis fermentans (strain ATCC 19989 / NBRC 14854 / NCTC 10117 / PG18) TaxID=496833 RepID=C4XF19_MYCFP|nr:hypothetical protein MBIO_0476 [Mycoplasmopsis fermentans PG18]VEU64111.1 Uncharacterised protein [Mycoplasmopsis fermentans]VEU66750.1 Uncharacterised protein [Mesomycoplasma conjunctivae]
MKNLSEINTKYILISLILSLILSLIIIITRYILTIIFTLKKDSKIHINYNLFFKIYIFLLLVSNLLIFSVLIWNVFIYLNDIFLRTIAILILSVLLILNLVFWIIKFSFLKQDNQLYLESKNNLENNELTIKIADNKNNCNWKIWKTLKSAYTSFQKKNFFIFKEFPRIILDISIVKKILVENKNNLFIIFQWKNEHFNIKLQNKFKIIDFIRNSCEDIEFFSFFDAYCEKNDESNIDLHEILGAKYNKKIWFWTKINNIEKTKLKLTFYYLDSFWNFALFLLPIILALFLNNEIPVLKTFNKWVILFWITFVYLTVSFVRIFFKKDLYLNERKKEKLKIDPFYEKNHFDANSYLIEKLSNFKNNFIYTISIVIKENSEENQLYIKNIKKQIDEINKKLFDSEKTYFKFFYLKTIFVKAKKHFKLFTKKITNKRNLKLKKLNIVNEK